MKQWSISQVYEDDGLPNMICHACKYQLDKSYQFRKKCQASDSKLRKHIKQIQRLSSEYEQTDETEGDEPNEDSGNSKQVKQLLADLVSSKGADISDADGEPIQVTEEEMVGGYILGKSLDDVTATRPKLMLRKVCSSTFEKISLRCIFST